MALLLSLSTAPLPSSSKRDRISFENVYSEDLLEQSLNLCAKETSTKGKDQKRIVWPSRIPLSTRRIKKD
ncbi:unnamed protein product [Cylicocyclus nassatus]|uniref:Uncharacterized protein n=1 Tax=Cylicocyclus nassatus TaxID=53992 RepID=A0AA36H144_CYLNA|nr:unnamed protein product [Cylicocyclus nassatus]